MAIEDQDQPQAGSRLPSRAALPSWTVPPPSPAPPGTAAAAPEAPPESGSSAGDDEPKRAVGKPDVAVRLAGQLALMITAAIAGRIDPDDGELLMTEDEQDQAGKAGRVVHRHVKLPGNATWDDAADIGEALLAVGSWAARLAGARLRSWRDGLRERRGGGQEQPQ